MSKVNINTSYNIHGHSDHVRGRLGEGRAWKNFTWVLLHNREPGKQKSEAKSILWRGGSSSHDPGDCASNVSFSLWSGLRTLLGYLAWMQLSGTELVVASERLSDQADRRLRKADNLFCSCGLSPHGDRSSSLCCVCCHRVYVSSFHVCCVQCARVVTAAPRGDSSRKAPLR